jgi:hypothetical protein
VILGTTKDPTAFLAGLAPNQSAVHRVCAGAFQSAELAQNQDIRMGVSHVHHQAQQPDHYYGASDFRGGRHHTNHTTTTTSHVVTSKSARIASQFQINLNWIDAPSELDSAITEAFTAAANRWSEVIVGDLAPGPYFMLMSQIIFIDTVICSQ